MKPHHIKICGFTQKEHVEYVLKLGIGAVGFVFYPYSKRYIPPHIVGNFSQQFPLFATKIGVTVNNTIDEIREIVKLSQVDIVQLHGDETPQFCKELSQSNIRWIKAFRVNEKFDFTTLATYPTRTFLLDAWDKDNYGGTGKQLSWKKLKNVTSFYTIILAGGIDHLNVHQAIKESGASYLDISSAVETSPGIKSLPKINRFLTQLSKN